MKKISTIVMELAFGIILFGIIVQLIILLALEDKVFYSIGLWAGCICAIAMAAHMKVSMSEALEMTESGADKHIKKTYVLRTVLVMGLIYVVFATKIGSVVTMFIGIMGLKVAAYIQPFTNRYLTKKIIGKGR